MGKIDGRTLSHYEQYERREQVVSLIEKGMSNHEISDRVGVCLTHVSTMRQKYRRGGVEALEPKVRGRKEGEQRLLSLNQETKIKTILIMRTPDQFGLDCHLWTRDAIRLAILQKCGVELQLRTITDYLSRWNFTPQKPIKDIKKKCGKAYRQWLKSGYLEIVEDSKCKKSEIYWVNDEQVKTANVGSTLKSLFSKDSINMISAISNQGKISFMLYRNDITESIFIKFLSNMIEDSDRKAVLILYNKEIYQSDFVHKWVDDRENDIDLEYLEDCYLGSGS